MPRSEDEGDALEEEAMRLADESNKSLLLGELLKDQRIRDMLKEQVIRKLEYLF